MPDPTYFGGVGVGPKPDAQERYATSEDGAQAAKWHWDLGFGVGLGSGA